MSCDHPRAKLTVIERGPPEPSMDGRPVPRIWTIEAECQCGAVVEVDYSDPEVDPVEEP